jgi:hypothetical protein
MLKLVKILGGRINQGESRKVNVLPLSEAISAGTPISICGDSVTAMLGEQEYPITHILDVSAPVGATTITVTDLLPGMIFSSVMLNNAEEYGIGTEYIVKSGGISSENVSTAGAGALVFDIPDRENSREILVTFRAN